MGSRDYSFIFVIFELSAINSVSTALAYSFICFFAYDSAADSLGAECQQCNTPCIEELRMCTGLPEVDNSGTLSPKNETDKNIILLPNKATGNNCNAFELQEIDEWYNVYDLTFVKSIQDAWNGDAKLLAVIIVLFSGIWPYLKVSQNLKRQKNNRHAIIHLSFNIVLSNLTLQQHPQEFDIGDHMVFTHKR